MKVLAKIGRVLFTVVAFAGIAALTFLYGLPGLVAGVVFGVALPWALRLRRARRSPKPVPPGPLRWRPRLRVAGLVSGLFAGTGTALLLTQYAGVAFGPATVVRGLVAGLVSGLVVPSVVWAFAVRAHNRRVQATPAAAPAVAGLLAGLWVVMATGGLLVALAPSAVAQVAGPCSLTVNRAAISGGASEFPVEPGGDIAWVYSAGSLAVSGDIWLRYGDVDVLLAGWRDRSRGAESHAGALPVDWLAFFGVGTYIVDVDLQLASGGRCSGSFSFTLEGDPLQTPIGAAGASMLALGAAGLVLPAARDGAELLAASTPSTEENSPPAPAEAGAVEQVTLTGEAARQVLERLRNRAPGERVDIEIPEDERWRLVASDEEQTLREDFIGTHGNVVGAGAIVEDDEGNIAIVVDVEVTPPVAPAESPPAESPPAESPEEAPQAPSAEQPQVPPTEPPLVPPAEPPVVPAGPPHVPLAEPPVGPAEPPPVPSAEPPPIAPAPVGPPPVTSAQLSAEPEPTDAPPAGPTIPTSDSPEATAAWVRSTLGGRGLLADSDVADLADFLQDRTRTEVEVPATFVGQRVGGAGLGGTLTEPEPIPHGVRIGLNTGPATVNVDLIVVDGTIRAELSSSNPVARVATFLAGDNLREPVARINASLAATGREVTAIQFTDAGFLRIATRPAP